MERVVLTGMAGIVGVYPPPARHRQEIMTMNTTMAETNTVRQVFISYLHHMTVSTQAESDMTLMVVRAG